MSKCRILFLDIDSVLNHSKYGSEELASEPVEAFVPICKDNLESLRYILNNVDDLKIVWSTSWGTYDEKYFNQWKNPRLWLEKLPEIKSRIIGITPRKMSSDHAEEIHFWFMDNKRSKRYDISNYAVLDDFDSYGMSLYGKHFFKSEYDSGLTLKQAEDIVEYLKTDDFDYNHLDWGSRDTRKK